MSRVVVCPEPLAALAGAHVFRLGGSAVDAAIATAFAQTVVSPAMTTIAGNGTMNVFHAPTGRHCLVDFMGYAGSRAAADMYERAPAGAPVRGYASVLVPTFVRGTYTAFERLGSGRVSWKALLTPAIRFAEEGFPVDPYLHQYWRAENPVQQTADRFDGSEMLSATEACLAIFTRQGRAPAIGERIVQPDLGRTLRALADEGPDVFYTGSIGRRLARDLEANGAPVTASDLAECRCLVGEPLYGTYRGYTVSTDSAPHIGILLVELLNVLEGYDVAALGAGSADYYDLMVRALAWVFRDRARYMTDPAAADLPVTMVDLRHAARLRGRIDEERAAAPLPGTTQVSTLDGDGSAVSFTHSVGTGSGVVTAGLGFMLNNNMMAFDPHPGRANSIAPGKRPIYGGGPAIVLQGGRVRHVLGSPHGGRKISAMGHVLVELIDFGRSPAAAVTSPRVHCEGDLADVRVEPFFPLPPDVRDALTARGLGLREDAYGGRVCLIAVDPASGRATGATDPRGGGGLAEV
ncbi:MAG TPA: gamma-glutamyltransferase [Methylomirabilota bacterium]|nr:gamma-glutamyltransferase [Methylomirabilota bacterium]